MQAYGARVLRWVNDADTATGKHDVQALAPLKRARWVNLPSQDPLHPGPALASGLPALCALLLGPAPDA